MAAVIREPSPGLLKRVSRSFYLSLRLLPRPMRGPAGLAYLLARASDTIADSSEADVMVRLDALQNFRSCVVGDAKWQDLGPEVMHGVGDGRERELLSRIGVLMDDLWSLREVEAALVRDVVCTIIDGQRLDVQRFAAATAAAPVALVSEVELDDYTWRVAGCVGVFWTKLGYATLGHRFSVLPEDSMLCKAEALGKGLQLVNILRDLPQDLSHGRCYLPVADVSDRDALWHLHQRYVIRAQAMVSQGFEYATCVKVRRARVASLLPAMLAAETLGMMQGARWEVLAARVKVPRKRVYQLMLKSFFE